MRPVKAVLIATTILVAFQQIPYVLADDNPDDGDPASYEFYPASPMYLGGGILPSDVTHAKPQCIQQFDTVDLDNGAALTTNFSLTYVTNTDQLRQALSIDAKIDASYLTFKGGASFSYNTKSLFSSSSMTAVLTANSDYGRLGIKQTIALNDIGNKWIHDGAAFANNCGTKLAIIEHRASRTYVIITINNVSSDDQSDMNTALSAQGGWGAMDVKASAKFDQQLGRSVGAQQVQVQVVATGGAGISALGDLLTGLANDNAIQSIQSIKSAMAKYLQTFSPQNSAPVAYDVTSMAFLGWNGDALDIWSDLRQRHLREIVTAYRDLSDKIDTIDSVTSGFDVRASRLSTSELGQLPALRTSYDTQRSVLAAAHKQCMTVVADPCNVPPKPTFPPNPIPDLPAAPSGNYALLRDDVDHSHDPYPPTNPYTVLNAIQTRAALAGINPWSDGFIWPLPPARSFDWPDVKLAQLTGADSWLVYLLKGTGIVEPVRVAFRADGETIYKDLPITALNGCPTDGFKNLNRLQNVPSTIQFCAPMEQGRSAGSFFMPGGNIVSFRGGLVDRITYWITNQMTVNNPPVQDGCTVKPTTVSGVFFLHVFDNYNRQFYLPVLKASWFIDHRYTDRAFGCYHASDSLTLSIIQ